MDKVGHSYPKTTNAIYTHATENMNNNLMAILENTNVSPFLPLIHYHISRDTTQPLDI